MDPPQPPSPPRSAVPTTSPKLRLMCSYGGRIIRRPRAKSLSYLGGETRLVAINPTSIVTLSDFISHLSATLSLNFPFSLKYQLPHSALDSLISLSSDDDLQFMLTEHIRISSSTFLVYAPSRIRLFIFGSSCNVIQHPKTEAWFVDALESAKILQRGRDGLGGYEGEGGNGDVEGRAVADLGNGAVSLAESMVLETSSSFGSSSSSASLANLPPVKPQEGDAGLSSLDNASEIFISNSSSHQRTEPCHGLIIQPPSVENAVMSIPIISESNFHDPARLNSHNMIGYALPSQTNHFQQGLQYIPAAAPVENCLNPGMFPISSYYPVQQPQPQQQFLHYQPNHMYPLYFLPLQWGLPDNASLVLPQEPHSEAESEPTPKENPTALKPDQIQQHNEFSDDPARIQIYKSQPPPPVVSSRFQNKSKPSATLLSDAMAQLQMIKLEQ